MRYLVADEPGVLSQITGILGNYRISISSIIQHEPAEASDPSRVPLIIMTHVCTESDASKAHEAIEQLSSVDSQCFKLRVSEG
jgi:homoserine dehydrogenase